MKSSDFLPLSAVLCVRNEEKRVLHGVSLIRQLPLEETIVVDGNSSDRTWEILKKFENINLIQGGDGGLLAQRLAGIRAARNKILLLLDIDDNISATDLTNAYTELVSDSGLDGLQFSLQSDGQEWFSRAWSNYLLLANPPQNPIPLLGRPCLTYQEHYTNLDPPKENILSDDLWLKFHMSEKARTFTTSKSKTIRDFPTTLRENIHKFTEYGISDFLISTDNAKRRELLKHAFWRIAVLRTFRSFRRTTWQYSPFPLLHGLTRGAAHLVAIFSKRQP